jgi:uncharacterized membrane protein YebE (DUF533 family)
MSKLVKIIIGVVIIGVIAYLVYRYYQSKKIVIPGKMPLNIITNNGSNVVSDLTNGLEADTSVQNLNGAVLTTSSGVGVIKAPPGSVAMAETK